MSTRRARIKAVTSLPPRRKNTENTDVKSKQLKESSEKCTKSPRTPRSVATKTLEIESPLKVAKCNTIKASTVIINNELQTPNNSKVNTTETSTPLDNIESEIVAPKLSEKVSVIKANTAVFASPVGLSPKFKSLNQQRNLTPHKALLNTQVLNEHNELQITHNYINKVTHNEKMPTNKIAEDYSISSVESIPDETVMDGITPLQSAGSAPKPIDILKNEIISENAEVLFDPIVPLPSPSKVRPKLRPTPRLGPHRRSSIQGSASESEDENRRAQMSGGINTSGVSRQRHDSNTPHSTLPSLHNREIKRVRNDSVCSSVSQATLQVGFSNSPLKEKHFTKSRRHDSTRRMTAMRRKRENVKRDALTMYDLIFYNPTTNPIVPDQDELKAKEENTKEESSNDNNLKEAESDADDPPEQTAAPVPQIKLGPNGEIILDEKSLVIKTTDSGRKVSSVVREGSWGDGGGGRYRRSTRSADWSAAETVRFYRALAAIGTDFTLMAPLFPDRSRKELKVKFKKEEKLNGAQVDKALRSATRWDAMQLQREFIAERAEAAQETKEKRERLLQLKQAERERARTARQLRLRNSKAARALETCAEPDIININDEVTTADQIIEREMEARLGKKATKTSKVQSSQFATLTLIKKNSQTPKEPTNTESATISTPNPNIGIPVETLAPNLNSTPGLPPNIESGSLVVLTVNDPSSPSKKMLQTYFAHGGGKLTPIALPANLLNSVVNYMKKGTPKSTVSSNSSPHFASPNSVTSQDSRTVGTPSVIQVNPSPGKRQRHSSFTITQL